MKGVSPVGACHSVCGLVPLPRGIIGPLHDPVTWYKVTHAGEQGAQEEYPKQCNSQLAHPRVWLCSM